MRNDVTRLVDILDEIALIERDIHLVWNDTGDS
jgi:hypothetical protein